MVPDESEILALFGALQFDPDGVGIFRVEVTDSGVGLSEDEHRNIFGEFTQFNKTELQGGGDSLSSLHLQVVMYTPLGCV